MVALTVYRWSLCLYPSSYRHEFAEEMTSVFCEARRALPPRLAAKVSFYQREFCGVVWGALRSHFDPLLGRAIPFRRFHMQPQFHFPRSTVFLMLLVFVGVVLSIKMASGVAGDPSGHSLRTLVMFFVFMLLTMCTAAAVISGILHALRRSGVHRMENVQSGTMSDRTR